MSTRFDPTHLVNPPIERLRIEGRDFVDPNGERMRFWGVNVVAFYPDRDTAIAFARNLASMGVNLVRLHHLLRHSLDWNPTSGIVGLTSYADDRSRAEPGGRDAVAWERLDFLVAELHRNGIYVMLSADFSRSYRAGDVSILSTTGADATAWAAAMSDMTAWSNAEWWATIDKWRMLSAIDERCALVQEEFVGQLLGRTNPHLGVTYAENPQIMGMEILNEFSSFYTIVNGNRFENTTWPLVSYFRDELIAKWNAYLAGQGISPSFDLYAPSNDDQHLHRQLFLNGLDAALRDRIVAKAASTGCEFPIVFSNLWRSESDIQQRSRLDPYSEDHSYGPADITVRSPYGQIWSAGGPEADAEDYLYAASVHAALADKPFVVGELNYDVNQTGDDAEKRAMMVLASAAYGAFQGWSGLVWFAWNHGETTVGADGWSPLEGTSLTASQLGGTLIADNVRIDHFRTAAMLYRNGYVDESVDPLTVWVDDPVWNSYGWPPAAKELIKPGWHSRNAIRKAYGPKPAGQDTSPMNTLVLPDPIVSDTRQISKNRARRQLSVATPKAEAFSGQLDGSMPDLLDVLVPDRASGFATVFVVSADGEDLTASKRLLLSRNTYADGAFDRGPQLKLRHLLAPSGNQNWFLRATRPRSNEAARWWRWLSPDGEGNIVLPVSDDWNEAELFYGVDPNGTQVTKPPTLAVVVKGTSLVELSWRDPSVSEVGYLVERAPAPGTAWQAIALLRPNTFTFTDGGLSADTVYHYRIRSGNWGGGSEPTDPVSVRTDRTPTLPAAPAAPTAPTIIDVRRTNVDFGWTDASSNENGFLVERAVGSGPFELRALVDIGTNVLWDWEVAPSTTYHYRVSSANAGGVSAPTAVVTATTPA